MERVICISHFDACQLDESHNASMKLLDSWFHWLCLTISNLDAAAFVLVAWKIEERLFGYDLAEVAKWVAGFCSQSGQSAILAPSASISSACSTPLGCRVLSVRGQDERLADNRVKTGGCDATFLAGCSL